METTEHTSEGAHILFTKYDLDVLHHVLHEVALTQDPDSFEGRTGCLIRDVQRLSEKMDQTFKRVMET